MTRKLREGHQIVPYLLYVHIPFAYLSKALSLNLEEQILRLDQVVCFICIGFEKMIESNQNTILDQVILLVLNEKNSATVQSCLS